MNDISKKVLNKIKKDQIKPKPKWEFLLKKSVFWGLFGLSIIIGGVAASIIIFMIMTNDWDIPRHLGNSTPAFIFKTLPYFWIIILSAFIGIAYYNFKHTDTGYKYRFSLFVVINILISVIIGFGLFNFGAAKRIDKAFLDHAPLYQELNHKPRVQMWTQPENGLLGGEVIELLEDNQFQIIDFQDKKWIIINTDPKSLEKPPIKEGIIIQSVGEIIDNSTFKAIKIRVWQGNFKEKPKPMKEMKMEMRIN